MHTDLPSGAVLRKVKEAFAEAELGYGYGVGNKRKPYTAARRRDIAERLARGEVINRRRLAAEYGVSEATVRKDIALIAGRSAE